MELVLEILDGEDKGSRTLIRDGMTIGRRKSSLTLQDPKVSGRHATIEKRADGFFWLVDAGSSNGIKVSNNRVLELKLELNTEFVLGNTRIQVRQRRSSSKSSEVAAPEKSKDNGANAAPPDQSSPDPEPVRTPVKTWQEILAGLVDRAVRNPAPNSRKAVAFHAPLKLRFIRGIQTGSEWVVGYGPRESGADSLDLPLEEPGLPALCFRLLPQHDSVLLKAEAPEVVRLNGQFVESALLRDGDVIEIKNTQIAVEFEG